LEPPVFYKKLHGVPRGLVPLAGYGAEPQF